MFDLIDELIERDCVFGFYTDLATELAPRGTNEQVVRLISAKKNGPAWLPGWRPGVSLSHVGRTTRLDVRPPIVDHATGSADRERGRPTRRGVHRHPKPDGRSRC